jgi:type IV pilus assembly protein PilM
MLSFDITDKQLKLVKGSLSGSKIRINAVGTRDVPDGSIVNGYVTNIPLVAGEITDMLAEMKISGKSEEIIVCINSSSILYKELEVLKPKTLKNTAAIEAMIITQMGIASDYNVSYSVVGDGKDESGQPTIKVMATACPQRMVDGYQNLFTQLGLKLKQINISNNCITRLILNTPKLKEVMPFLCIQVDVDFININLYEDGQVALSRYVKIDPSDYENNPDYINIAVFDNLFRMIQFIGQRPNSKPLKQIMFYGIIKDFVALSNSILSFNIPAHVLAMPTNIVKFCEVDFSKYANAIGAFYKVDPLMEHINLLQSKAVKSKQSANTFPLKVLLSGAIGAGVVAGVWMYYETRNNSLKKQADEVQVLIDDGDYETRQREMDLAEAVKENFSEYKYSVQLSQVLFDFLPRGNLPQISQELAAGLTWIEENDDLEMPAFVSFQDVVWSNYTISMDVYCSGIDFPSDYVEALTALEFFEDNIRYSGFELAERSDVNSRDIVFGAVPGSGDITTFRLELQLKGGHIFDDDGNRYVYEP